MRDILSRNVPQNTLSDTVSHSCPFGNHLCKKHPFPHSLPNAKFTVLLSFPFIGAVTTMPPTRNNVTLLLFFMPCRYRRKRP